MASHLQTQARRRASARTPQEADITTRIGGIMGYVGPPSENHLRRNALPGRAWIAGLLLGLSLQPLNRD